MKMILILALVISCAGPQIKGPETTATKPSRAEGRPVSPYTVKPCYCMKIFRPVCAEGINYGNSCEAECHGHKSWTEGPCKEQ
jgi:hypothetical protein